MSLFTSKRWLWVLVGSTTLSCGQIAGLGKFESADEGDGDGDVTGDGDGDTPGDGDGDGDAPGDGDGDVPGDGDGDVPGDGDGDAGGGSGTGGGPASGGTDGSGGNDGSGGDGTGGAAPILGGYHERADWRGYAFTLLEGGADISPNNFDDLSTDGPYCVSGTVPGTADYEALAALGFNVNETRDGIGETIVPSGDGLLLDLSINSGAEIIRVQFDDGTPPSDPDYQNHRWCAMVSGSGRVIIPWDSFNTECWNPENGLDYGGEPIERVLIYTPDVGEAGGDTPFDFCVNDIGPLEPPNCSASSFTVDDAYADNGTLCGYAFSATFDGGMITPNCGSGSCFEGSALCASAMLPPEDEGVAYPGVLIGWNVAQSTDGGPPQTWTVSGTGITVDYTATGATQPARLVVRSGGTDYCADAVTSGVAVPWSSFATECWAPGGTSLSVGAPISNLVLQLNATNSTQNVTQFCLDDVVVN